MSRWVKIERGFYRLDGTLYAVMADGYGAPSKSIGAHPGYEGFVGGEWAVVRFRDEADFLDRGGENLDWYDTMRRARADAERRARHDARRVLNSGQTTTEET